MRVKNAEGKEAVWTIDLKTTGTVYKGEPKTKANVTIIMSDETFQQLAEGKLDGQKAFMSGKLKTKGNMMFATKLDGILKVRCSHPACTLLLMTAVGREDEGEAVIPHHCCCRYLRFRIITVLSGIPKLHYAPHAASLNVLRHLNIDVTKPSLVQSTPPVSCLPQALLPASRVVSRVPSR